MLHLGHVNMTYWCFSFVTFRTAPCTRSDPITIDDRPQGQWLGANQTQSAAEKSCDRCMTAARALGIGFHRLNSMLRMRAIVVEAGAQCFQRRKWRPNELRPASVRRSTKTGKLELALLLLPFLLLLAIAAELCRSRLLLILRRT